MKKSRSFLIRSSECVLCDCGERWYKIYWISPASLFFICWVEKCFSVYQKIFQLIFAKEIFMIEIFPLAQTLLIKKSHEKVPITRNLFFMLIGWAFPSPFVSYVRTIKIMENKTFHRPSTQTRKRGEKNKFFCVRQFAWKRRNKIYRLTKRSESRGRKLLLIYKIERNVYDSFCMQRQKLAS